MSQLHWLAKSPLDVIECIECRIARLVAGILCLNTFGVIACSLRVARVLIFLLLSCLL